MSDRPMTFPSDMAVRMATKLLPLLTRRAEGHTPCMQVGIDNHRGPVIVIARSTAAAQDAAYQRRHNRDKYPTAYVGLATGQNLAGLRGAVAMDPYAAGLIIGGLLRHIGNLEHRLATRHE